MSQTVGSLRRQKRAKALGSWLRGLWARYWRDAFEVAMLASFVVAGFLLHPVAGFVVLGLAFFYVVWGTGRQPEAEKDGDGDASAG